MKNFAPIKILVILSVVIITIHLIPSQKNQAAYANTSSQVIVMVSNLNIRQDADISSRIIGRAHHGDRFEIVNTTDSWVQIKLSGSQTGWVYRTYVTTAEKTAAIVKNFVLNVRDVPSISGRVTAQLKPGAKITVLEEQAGWARIESTSAVRGWVNEYYIAKGAPSGIQRQLAAPSQTAQKDSGTTTATDVSEAANSDNSKLPPNNLEPLSGKTIVLDPGHGGYDNGTTSIKGTHEKALTLATAKAVETKLENAGANVIMTRNSDTYIPLLQRADLSKQHRADAFISFHYNWSNDPSVKGLTDFYYQKAKDDPLAADILKDVVKTTNLPFDGTRFDNLDVLRNNKQPSTLIELGFLSNKQDDSLVESSDYRDEVAQGVYLGLLDYFSTAK